MSKGSVIVMIHRHRPSDSASLWLRKTYAPTTEKLCRNRRCFTAEKKSMYTILSHFHSPHNLQNSLMLSIYFWVIQVDVFQEISPQKFYKHGLVVPSILATCPAHRSLTDFHPNLVFVVLKKPSNSEPADITFS
jgi:hypothetical protein